jgi:glutamate N-acetyltransferase/amino-acid N-acetyltransferase
MNPDIVTVTLSSAVGAVQIVAGGQGTDYSEDDVAALLKETDIKVDVDLGIGDAKAVGWGCDLSYEYVKINGAYRT